MTDGLLRSYTRGSTRNFFAVSAEEEAAEKVITRLGDIYNPGDGFPYVTGSIDIGTAATDRFIVTATKYNSAVTVTSVLVGGVGLSAVVQASFPGSGGNNDYLSIWAGIVSTGSGSQTVTANATGSGFHTMGLTAWSMTGLSSTTPVDTAAVDASAGGTLPITQTVSVTAGDFLIAFGRVNAGTPNYSSSTETPDNSTINASYAGLMDAYWTVDSTNASFDVKLASSSNTNKSLIAAAWA